jgi:hypothetical protein
VRRARHLDSNHGAIRDLLRKLGCIVADTSDVGRGFPDLVVRTPRGRAVLVEVKNPKRAKGRRELDGQQAEMAAQWGDSYRVVETDDDAIELARS